MWGKGIPLRTHIRRGFHLSDTSTVGNEEHVSDRLADLARVGVTELCAWTFGTVEDQQRTADLLVRRTGR